MKNNLYAQKRSVAANIISVLDRLDKLSKTERECLEDMRKITKKKSLSVERNMALDTIIEILFPTPAISVGTIQFDPKKKGRANIKFDTVALNKMAKKHGWI